MYSWMDKSAVSAVFMIDEEKKCKKHSIHTTHKSCILHLFLYTSQLPSQQNSAFGLKDRETLHVRSIGILVYICVIHTVKSTADAFKLYFHTCTGSSSAFMSSKNKELALGICIIHRIQSIWRLQIVKSWIYFKFKCSLMSSYAIMKNKTSL